MDQWVLSFVIRFKIWIFRAISWVFAYFIRNRSLNIKRKRLNLSKVAWIKLVFISTIPKTFSLSDRPFTEKRTPDILSAVCWRSSHEKNGKTKWKRVVLIRLAKSNKNAISPSSWNIQHQIRTERNDKHKIQNDKSARLVSQSLHSDITGWYVISRLTDTSEWICTDSVSLCSVTSARRCGRGVFFAAIGVWMTRESTTKICVYPKMCGEWDLHLITWKIYFDKGLWNSSLGNRKSFFEDEGKMVDVWGGNQMRRFEQ